MKKFAVGAACILMTFFFCSCSQISAGAETSMDINTEVSSQLIIDPARRITAQETDVDFPRVDQLFTNSGLHVSKSLQSAMEQYKEEDVFFRVVAEIPYPEYGGTECFVFAIQAGALNISSSLLSSDVPPYPEANGSYFMDVTYDILSQLIKHRGYVLRLAPSERMGEYSEKISDSLTVALDQMKAMISIHVAVVCQVDQQNSFLNKRGIFSNPRYNEHLFHPLTGNLTQQLTDQSIIDYVDEIVERNHLTDKRVFNPQHPDTDPVRSDFVQNEYNGMAGFEVKLTKKELLALTDDPDVKVIHPMKASGNHNNAEEATI